MPDAWRKLAHIGERFAISSNAEPLNRQPITTQKPKLETDEIETVQDNEFGVWVMAVRASGLCGL